jgi:alkylated DNA repair dioxygenase AlkB
MVRRRHRPRFGARRAGKRPAVGTTPPDGLIYQPDLLTPDGEQAVIDLLERIGFETVEMRGQVARRTVRHFGLRYDYTSRGLAEAEPVPEELEPLRRRIEELAGLAPGEFRQMLAQRYPPGAPIGWHRDSPPFGVIGGISLGSPSRMRFRRRVRDETVDTYDQLLAPRSGYVLSGEVRNAWQHHVPPVKDLRYSLTFRSLRHPERRPLSALATFVW